MIKIYYPFLQLLACIVNHMPVDWRMFKGFTPQNWEQFYRLAQKQGVVAILFEVLREIPQEMAPPRTIMLKWIAQALSIEEQMRKKEAIASELAERLAARGIRTMVLKGLAYASYYPNPYHRESGDLDCYLMGKKAEGDQAVVAMGGMMEEAGYKHSHLRYKGLTIENHQFLTSFDNTKLGIRTERLLQGLIAESSRPIGNTRLLTPSPDFTALFLIKHAQRHFIKEGIRIRHLLDWAFFIKAESQNVNWDKVIPIMKECRILEFAKVMTRLCIEQLGMKIDIEGLSSPSKMSNVVLADILDGQPDLLHENFAQKIGRIIRRFYRMWKFRSIADESYPRMIWNNIVFNSYFHRVPNLKKS